MVVERNPVESIRNGRSRGPSPNGHTTATPDSSDDDSSKKTGSSKQIKTKSEYEEKIRVGKDYQTICPDLIPVSERKLEALNDRALLVWSPTNDIPDNKLEEYIAVAKEKYGYNGEQALGMLFWHKHDLERAVLDLANFTPFPDEWTEEDKVLFEQAFQFHGKSFHRIRQMLPDKTIASLVKHYYSWKKTRSRTNGFDRPDKIKIKDGSENGSEGGSNEESDNEDKIQNNKQLVSSLKRKSADDIDDIMQADSSNRLNTRWTGDELQLAVKGVQTHGKDFQAIAELLGTKTEAQVRSFFLSYRRKYNLDEMVEEFEKNNNKTSQENSENNVKSSNELSDVASTSKSVGEVLTKIDLDDDIPMGREDDDIEEVTIIENNTIPAISIME